MEIASAVADGEHSVILPQVTFGIAVRMAVMSIIAGNTGMKILIRGGRVVDPASGLRCKSADVAMASGRIVAIGRSCLPTSTPSASSTASGCVVAPGLVDLAVRACANPATSTRACWKANWPRPPPAA